MYLFQTIILPAHAPDEIPYVAPTESTSYLLMSICFVSLVLLTLISQTFRNSIEKKWFKAKRYGYGWYPSSFQGWFILLIYIGFDFTSFIYFDSRSHSNSDTLINFIPAIILATILLIVICINTGEKSRWRWGREK